MLFYLASQTASGFAECAVTADQLNAHSALLLGTVGAVWVVNTSVTPFSPKIKGSTSASGRDDLGDHNNPNFRNQISESIDATAQTRLAQPLGRVWDLGNLEKDHSVAQKLGDGHVYVNSELRLRRQKPHDSIHPQARHNSR